MELSIDEQIEKYKRNDLYNTRDAIVDLAAKYKWSNDEQLQLVDILTPYGRHQYYRGQKSMVNDELLEAAIEMMSNFKGKNENGMWGERKIPSDTQITALLNAINKALNGK